MIIRYADGVPRRKSIADQQRIWENLQIEREVEEENRRRTSPAKVPKHSLPKFSSSRFDAEGISEI
jgi:hypothetical protein